MFFNPIYTVLILFVTASPVMGEVKSALTQEAPRPLTAPLPQGISFEKGPVVPGLHQGAIPQGLAYDRQHDAIIVSHYFTDKKSSRLSVIDNGSGRLMGTPALKGTDQRPHFGHVGGVAVNSGSVWLASDNSVYQYDLDDLFKTDQGGPIAPLARYKPAVRTSFCTYYQGMLFVGEFAYGNKYKTRPSHHMKDRQGKDKFAWACGYQPEKGFATPDMILSIPQKVQGINFTGEFVFLSISYGRRHSSRIEIYKNPLKAPPHKQIRYHNGTVVPLWFLDGENFIRSIDLPPMSQGITPIKGKLAVLFESGAQKYQLFGKGPIDNIVFLSLEEFFK